MAMVSLSIYRFDLPVARLLIDVTWDGTVDAVLAWRWHRSRTVYRTDLPQAIRWRHPINVRQIEEEVANYREGKNVRSYKNIISDN